MCVYILFLLAAKQLASDAERVSSFFFVYLYLFFNREIFINENERGYICLYEETSVPKMEEEEKRLLLLYK